MRERHYRLLLERPFERTIKINGTWKWLFRLIVKYNKQTDGFFCVLGESNISSVASTSSSESREKGGLRKERLKKAANEAYGGHIVKIRRRLLPEAIFFDRKLTPTLAPFICIQYTEGYFSPFNIHLISILSFKSDTIPDADSLGLGFYFSPIPLWEGNALKAERHLTYSWKEEGSLQFPLLDLSEKLKASSLS